MYTKEQYNDVLTRTSKTIDISDEMFDKAVFEYDSLGKWIDQATPDYIISIYPQGSFALGTVVRPISNKDDYDLDLVCEFAQRYNLSARQLKCDIVKPLLISYKKMAIEIEEKRRCWRVEYEDVPFFHMDVVPAYHNGSRIQITEHDEDRDEYSYLGSSPSGYIEWFFSKCAKQHMRLYERYVKEHRLVVAQADIEKIKRRKVKTPLQCAVQLLKRHRDIKFAEKDQSLKPISIIITTIAASLYNEEDTVYEALESILNNAIGYIINSKREGRYYIENPSYPGENFADKWNVHPERATAFIFWLDEARKELIECDLVSATRVDMSKRLQSCFGTVTVKSVFSQLAKEDANAIMAGQLKIESTTGNLSRNGNVSIPPNHHHGK